MGDTGKVPDKVPNEQLGSWFLRSGWSKGELARQVNRRARQLGAHHVSTDTSRVRRWLDGEQPREPIPRILSELFSERFGCVLAAEDLGLRSARQSPAASGVDLPWAGPQTVAMIGEFTRSDLMLGRRGFLGSSLSVAAGPSLIEPMQRWLVPSPAGGPWAKSGTEQAGSALPGSTPPGPTPPGSAASGAGLPGPESAGPESGAARRRFGAGGSGRSGTASSAALRRSGSSPSGPASEPGSRDGRGSPGDGDSGENAFGDARVLRLPAHGRAGGARPGGGRGAVPGSLSVVPDEGCGRAVGAASRAAAGGESPGLSVPELELLERTTEMFRQWDAQCGGGLRRKAVVGQLHEITELLHRSHSERIARRLFRLMGELAQLAGWMSFDVGLHPTAQKYFVLALHAAKEAGDHPLGCYVLSSMARQMIHLGRGEDALELVHLAQYGGRESATPRTQALLHAVEARAYANLGRPAKCKRAVRMAEDTFCDVTEGDGDPDWVRFFTEAELNAETAHSYRDLAYVSGRSPAYASLARPAMERAVALFRQEHLETGGGGHRRSYALNLLGMASVHLLQHEPQGCASHAVEAIDLAKRLRSERVHNRLRTTAAWAVRDFGDVAEVALLGERLAVELPEEGEAAAAV